MKLSEAEAEAAIERFQECLRFETISATAHSTGEYVKCAEFLRKELESIPYNNTNAEDNDKPQRKQLLKDVHFLPEAPDHSPVVIAHWPGKDSTLPILLLNSHYDVVPADLEAWTVPPFGATRSPDGKIYGRGTQDMKCVSMQYIEAIRKIHAKHPDWQPERDIYLTFVPDEEIGGSGMAAFLDSDLYKNRLPGIALALDEGLASTTNVFDVFYGERLPWWVEVTATGPTGHGSRFIENTAVEQLLELSQKAMAFRKGQRDLLEMSHHHNCTHAVVAKKKNTLGDVTSLNITSLQAGVRVGNTFAYNVVPSLATCSLDIRISPRTKPQEIKDMLDKWCKVCSKDPEKGSVVTWKSVDDSYENQMSHATTNTDRSVNPWYAAFCDAMEGMGCEISPQIFPAATDSRFLRALGIRALGFSPMRNTEIMLHEHNEYILEENFLEGIGIYVGLIHSLGSQTKAIDLQSGTKRKAEAIETSSNESATEGKQ
jgi:aminoacylase